MRGMKQLALSIAGLALAVAGSGTAMAAGNRTLVVKAPLNNFTAVAMRKGWLQEEFAKAGAKVALVDVAAMKIPGVEASLMEKGELHFINCMGYVSIQHKLNGLDSVVVWASKFPNPRRAATVVLKNSPANSLSDLKGKNLGGWRISCPYFATYEALKAKGVQQDTEFQKGDVRFTNINTYTQVSALLSGRVDALSVHPGTNNFAPLYTQGLVKEVGTGVPNGAYVTGGGRSAIFVLKEFARKHPELVQAYIRAYASTVRWTLANPDAAAAIIAREMRIPKAVAKFTIVDSSQMLYTPGEPDAKAVITSYNNFQAWGIRNGDDFLRKKNLNPTQIEAFIDKRFFKGGQYSVY